MELEALLTLLRALNTEGVRYVVIGGVALNIHGLPRATADVDIFVSPDSSNITHLRAALRSAYDDPQVDQITAEDLSGRYPAIQYVPPDGSFHIDILARLGETFAFEDIESEEREIEGVKVNVATPAMLYRMKKDTVRLQDKADAARLRDRFGLEDVVDAD